MVSFFFFCSLVSYSVYIVCGNHIDTTVFSQKSNTTYHSSSKRWCSAAVTFMVIAGAGIFVLFYGSTIWDRLGGGGQVPPFFTWEDNDNSTQEDFKSWRTKGGGKNGLKLTVVNAMTSDWYTYFNQAVANWDVAPALSLTVLVADPDPDCGSIPGKLKVCNDAYGKLGWSGLNEAWLDSSGAITASTAKMNESYLKGSDFSEKLYVCCHEIGHGFGLPHRDTNVMNPNIGTCLDYTTSYFSNMKPDDVDFQNLEKLYGIVGQKRQLRFVNSNDEANLKEVPINARSRSYKNGRLLYKSEHKEIYEEQLSDGGRIITTLLLAKEDNLVGP